MAGVLVAARPAGVRTASRPGPAVLPAPDAAALLALVAECDVFVPKADPRHARLFALAHALVTALNAADAYDTAVYLAARADFAAMLKGSCG